MFKTLLLFSLVARRRQTFFLAVPPVRDEASLRCWRCSFSVIRVLVEMTVKPARDFRGAHYTCAPRISAHRPVPLHDFDINVLPLVLLLFKIPAPVSAKKYLLFFSRHFRRHPFLVFTL